MTNVTAQASMTLDWLSATPSIAIPIYQRDYRWTQGSCEQLLADVRAIASAPNGRTHFIGSILSTPEQSGGVTLVDGQQRVTTIMLMLAAIRAHAVEGEPHTAAAIDQLTLAPGPAMTPRLRSHGRHLAAMTKVMAGEGIRTILESDGPVATAFEENFVFLYERLERDWRSAWEGLHRLEHVTISLQPNASAQQIFESLNSTGAALSDDELIHNYIHMGLTHGEQVRLEQDTWAPIQETTRGRAREFWRDYLVLTSRTQPDFSGEFGIYRAFRRYMQHPQRDLTEKIRSEWVHNARLYGVLLDPSQEPDSELREQLDLLQAFGGARRPILLGLYGDQLMDRPRLVATLEQLQSLFIRRTLVGLARDIGLSGTLCRDLRADPKKLPGAILRRTPEDPAVRLALTHSALPLAGYVLRRLQHPACAQGLQIEHIYPQTPLTHWTGGDREWGELGNDEQARYRTLLNTIGNLTLLEAELNAGASNRSFRDKAAYYARSRVQETRDLAERHTWDAASIEERTEHLVDRFLTTWPRRSDVPMDEPQELTRVVDLVIPRNSNADPDRFEYVVFRGELWGDVHKVKTLHLRVTNALDQLDSERLRTSEYGSHITATPDSGGRSAVPLEHGGYVYQGWWPCYLLEVVQAWITAFELDDEVRVKVLAATEQGHSGTRTGGKP